MTKLRHVVEIAHLIERPRVRRQFVALIVLSLVSLYQMRE